MKLVLILAAAIALFAFGGTSVAKPAHAGNSVTITSSVNPSQAGDSVTFTVTGVSGQANVVTFASVVNLATSETTRYVLSPVNGVATFTHTFASAGEYYVPVFQQRNGKQVQDLAHIYQTVE